MGAKTKIEWADASWNPIVGCSVVSPGCTNCYAMRQAARFERMHEGIHRPHLLAGGGPAPQTHYAGTTQDSKGGPVWTGKVALAPDHILTAPLRWKNPRRIFVNSMGDLFHESVPDAWIDRVFAVMALAPQHNFLVLTKRSQRMRAYLSAARAHPVGMVAFGLVLEEMACNPKSNVGAGIKLKGDLLHLSTWPLLNVWLGVSAEDQRRYDERASDLKATPATVHFFSFEPLLGPIRADYLGEWAIVGGESGPGARPMHPTWARDIRDKCAAAGVPFFFKQHGEWIGVPDLRRLVGGGGPGFGSFDHCRHDMEAEAVRVGKARAGRLLDGVEHNGMPEVRS